MCNKIITDAVIVGAGISGLATAHFLTREGLQVRILEKNNRVGGNIYTHRVDGFLAEYGPNSMLDTTPILHQLFADLQIEDQVEYASDSAKKRYIVRGGRLHPLPMSPFAFLKTQLFSPRAKWRLIKEPFISASVNGHDESLADFVVRRLGTEFLDYAIDPFVAGVYAGLPEKLSVRSAFPKLYDLEVKYGSLIRGAIRGARERRKRAERSKQSARLLSFKDGMGALIRALEQRFHEEIFTGVQLLRIQQRNGGFGIAFRVNEEEWEIETSLLVLTVPAYAYAELPLELELTSRSLLTTIYYPPLAMVFFGYRKNPARIPLDGFGFLIPRKEGRRILGTLWNSSIFTNRAPEGGVALTSFVGGGRQPDLARLPEEELTALVREDLRDLMGITDPPDVVIVQKWERAIPQYELGHHRIIEHVERDEARYPGLYISGNFRGGISVSDCIKNAYELSQRVVEEHRIRILKMEGD
ncbi:MAG: protoporphyrinogen oxidase [Calditrichaeota bacterium]|nr:protoporphyrinogen oxidase [Calditrichota bacterium]